MVSVDVKHHVYRERFLFYFYIFYIQDKLVLKIVHNNLCSLAFEDIKQKDRTESELVSRFGLATKR